MPDRHDDLLEPIAASPALDALLDERDTILISTRLTSVRLDTETQLVRAAEPRTDAKASSYLTLASGLLLAGLTLLGSGRLPEPAAAAGWTAAALDGAAVLLLTAAQRPNLRGDFGFVRWARTRRVEDLLDAVAAAPSIDSTEQARQLHWLSRSLYRKFLRVRQAQTLLVAALSVAAAAAALSVWAR